MKAFTSNLLFSLALLFATSHALFDSKGGDTKGGDGKGGKTGDQTSTSGPGGRGPTSGKAGNGGSVGGVQTQNGNGGQQKASQDTQCYGSCVTYAAPITQTGANGASSGPVTGGTAGNGGASNAVGNGGGSKANGVNKGGDGLGGTAGPGGSSSNGFSFSPTLAMPPIPIKRRALLRRALIDYGLEEGGAVGRLVAREALAWPEPEPLPFPEPEPEPEALPWDAYSGNGHSYAAFARFGSPNGGKS